MTEKKTEKKKVKTESEKQNARISNRKNKLKKLIKNIEQLNFDGLSPKHKKLILDNELSELDNYEDVALLFLKDLVRDSMKD